MKGSDLYCQLFLLVYSFVTACPHQTRVLHQEGFILGSIWLTFQTCLIALLQLFHSFHPHCRITKPLQVLGLLKGKSFRNSILRGLLHSL